MEIVDSGSSGYFFTKDVPKTNLDPTAPHIQVGTASGQPMTSVGTCDIVIPQIPSDLPNTGYVMPVFQENLIGVGTMCDANFTVTFSKHAVNIYGPTGTSIITAWRENYGPCLWRMSPLPNSE